MTRFSLLILLLYLLCFSSVLLAQPLTGNKTIGGTDPDYATFAAATSALSANGVGAGGVTFDVRPGIYSEMVLVPYISSASADNPIVFRNASQTQTVQISPSVTGATRYGVKLSGARYITFNNIDVIDTSTGTYPLYYGYWCTNSSATQGAQYNTIINATIRTRITATYNTYGIYQYRSTTPTSVNGAQSYNTYLNLKISKATYGVVDYGYLSYPDVGTEIGSDSTGLNYSNRFTVGAMVNDTIGGPQPAYGVYMGYVSGASIHDIDITNLKTYNIGSVIKGIYLENLSSTARTLVYNNRIYNLQTSDTTDFGEVNAILISQTTSNGNCRIYNNMIYNLQKACGVFSIPSVCVTGINSSSYTPTIVNNTIVLNQTGTLNYSSACIRVSNASANDSIMNNIFANLCRQNYAITYHFCIENRASGTNLKSNNNCFYLPYSFGGYIALYFDGQTDRHLATLADWQSALTPHPDTNSVSGNPFFIDNASNHHIRLSSGSPVGNQGIPFSWITTDIDGESRSGTSPDIGADEGFFTELIGTKTIGGTNPDYATFAEATAALTANGVGPGGTRFLVRPGIYPEMVLIPNIPSASTDNPIVFRNDMNQTGTVQVSPPATGTSQYGVKLNGAQYTTFNGIDVVDTSTGTNFLTYGYYVTNSSSSQGAQHNVVKNATIQLRIGGGHSAFGVYQTISYAPTSLAGTQSYNTYLNLKISKVSYGVYLYGSYLTPDIGTVIGSDSSGVNYANRFTIGAMVNDTIGGYSGCQGIRAEYVNGITIHDIDITNLKNLSTYTMFGINLYEISGSEPKLVYNNRIYNLKNSTATFSTMFGIAVNYSHTNGVCRIYNNMIYDIQQTSTASATSAIHVNGIYCTDETPTIVNNTIVLNQNGIQNYSSACIRVFTTTQTDTIRNNIFANLGVQLSNTPFHLGIYASGGNPHSDYNCFYIPNTLRGYVGYHNGNFRTDLAAWSEAFTPNTDLHSVSGNPGFMNMLTAPYDPHIQLSQPSSIVNYAGTPLSWITTDIDGEAREVIRPDIGADEGNFSTQLLLAPSSVNFAGTRPNRTDSILVTIQNVNYLSFRYLTLTGAGSGAFSKRVMVTDSNMNAGDSLKIWISFTPDTLKNYYDTLRLTFPPPYNSITIPISGVGTGYYVSLPDTILNFHTATAPGQTDSLELLLLLSGNDSLRNGRWITIPSTAPFSVQPDPMPTVTVGNWYHAWVRFTPTTTGIFTAQIGLVSNALNGDTLLVSVTAYSQTIGTPGLSITASRENAVLNWTQPDTIVQRYLIYFRSVATSPWQFYAYTSGYNSTLYTHQGVVRFSPQMYYQVTAWYGGSTDSFDRIIRTIPVGTPKEEVVRILQSIER